MAVCWEVVEICNLNCNCKVEHRNLNIEHWNLNIYFNKPTFWEINTWNPHFVILDILRNQHFVNGTLNIELETWTGTSILVNQHFEKSTLKTHILLNLTFWETNNLWMEHENLNIEHWTSIFNILRNQHLKPTFCEWNIETLTLKLEHWNLNIYFKPTFW